MSGLNGRPQPGKVPTKQLGSGSGRGKGGCGAGLFAMLAAGLVLDLVLAGGAVLL